MDDSRILAFFFILIGLFSFLGGYLNWDWFMVSRKTRWMLRLLGRNGTRIFYIVLGLAMAGCGVLGVLGVVDVR